MGCVTSDVVRGMMGCGCDGLWMLKGTGNGFHYGCDGLWMLLERYERYGFHYSFAYT